MDCSPPGFPVFHRLPELAQTQVHWVSGANGPLFKNFLQFVVTHTVKSFGLVSKEVVDVFLEFSCQPDVHAGFRKGRGTRDQIASICWTIEKAREFQKNIYFCFIDYAKALDCVGHKNTMENSSRDGNITQTTLPASWEICMQVKKQQSKPNMEQQSGSK